MIYTIILYNTALFMNCIHSEICQIIPFLDAPICFFCNPGQLFSSCGFGEKIFPKFLAPHCNQMIFNVLF